MNIPVVQLGRARAERADAARNRAHLLGTARAMIEEEGAGHLTMDALAERAGLGKGTVFRRFGTRAGIFRALLEDSESAFQESVLAGPPPLGPGAEPGERLAAYGRARFGFLRAHIEVARESAGAAPRPGPLGSFSVLHLRMLLTRMDLPGVDPGAGAVLLAAAVETPLLLFIDGAPDGAQLPEGTDQLAATWEALAARITG
ncbi:TetR/AcrR family transcriptional regulator [Nocardiopsis coralliicola]